MGADSLRRVAGVGEDVDRSLGRPNGKRKQLLIYKSGPVMSSFVGLST